MFFICLLIRCNFSDGYFLLNYIVIYFDLFVLFHHLVLSGRKLFSADFITSPFSSKFCRGPDGSQSVVRSI